MNINIIIFPEINIFFSKSNKMASHYTFLNEGRCISVILFLSLSTEWKTNVYRICISYTFSMYIHIYMCIYICIYFYVYNINANCFAFKICNEIIINGYFSCIKIF